MPITINTKWIYRADNSKIPNNMDFNGIKRFIKKMKFNEFYESLGGEGTWDYNISNDHRYPAFVESFYTLFAEQGHIPSPQAVCNHYYKKHCVDFPDDDTYGMLKDVPDSPIFRKDDLFAMICVAYKAWCKEISLLYAAFEYLPKGYHAYYNIGKDLKGVDIVVKHKSFTYNIHSFLDSKAAWGHRKMKDAHRTPVKGKHMDFPANEFNTFRCGEIEIHGHDSVSQLLDRMDAFEDKCLAR